MSLAAPLARAAQVRPVPLPYEATPIVLGLAVFALAAFAPAVLSDGDTWTHVATGDWILDHRAIPRVDPFTFSFAGAPWVAHEWGADVLFALARRLAAIPGVVEHGLFIGLAQIAIIAGSDGVRIVEGS